MIFLQATFMYNNLSYFWAHKCYVQALNFQLCNLGFALLQVKCTNDNDHDDKMEIREQNTFWPIL